MVQTSLTTITGALGVCTKFGVLHGPASAELKLLPVTATIVPMGPMLGVSTMNGVLTVTVKLAEAVSPVAPVTVSVYVPGVAEGATVNPPVN